MGKYKPVRRDEEYDLASDHCGMDGDSLLFKLFAAKAALRLILLLVVVYTIVGCSVNWDPSNPGHRFRYCAETQLWLDSGGRAGWAPSEFAKVHCERPFNYRGEE